MFLVGLLEATKVAFGHALQSLAVYLLGYILYTMMRGVVNRDIYIALSFFDLRLIYSLMVNCAITAIATLLTFLLSNIWYWILVADEQSVKSELSERSTDLLKTIHQEHPRPRVVGGERDSQSLRLSRLEPELVKKTNEISRLKKALDKANQHAQNQKQNIKLLESREGTFRNTIHQLQGQLAAVHQSWQKTHDLQFELELLKCTQEPRPVPKSTPEGSFTAFASPFVLVLVDGDAYAWASKHFEQTEVPAGAHAAQAIKDEVQRFLLDHRDRVSLHSRIVTRVFQNQHFDSPEEPLGKNAGKRSRRRIQGAEFAIPFTESMPLFDYMDCGRGKERADSKIQENVQLFIANPYCHTIFLAACTDNGFARLLEQYACIEAAKQKVILVHCGYVVSQTGALGYTAVEWPSVFKRKNPSPDVASKEARDRQRQENEKRRREVAAVRAVVERASGLGAFDAQSTNRKLGLHAYRGGRQVKRGAASVTIQETSMEDLD